MKINLKYYNCKDEYTEGKIEREIINYCDKYSDNLEQVFDFDMRWGVFYHLSKLRQNILEWYDFKENADILEIGAGMGAITKMLCKKAKYVTAIELSKQRAECIATRCKDVDNLEIIVANFNDVIHEKKYDYITLIGVLEYANLYTNTKNSYVDFLRKVKSLLKPEGKLLIGIENKFGLKYFAGAREDHSGIKYDSLTGYQNKTIHAVTFGKSELEKILKEAGFKYSNFYYPMPDYKFPEVIYSDTSLPTNENIKKYHPYYLAGTTLNFEERDVYSEIIKENMFPFFANSFFIECSGKNFLNNADYIEYNNFLKENSRKTKIKRNNGYFIQGKKVTEKKFNKDIVGDIDLNLEKTFNKRHETIDEELFRVQAENNLFHQSQNNKKSFLDKFLNK